MSNVLIFLANVVLVVLLFKFFLYAKKVGLEIKDETQNAANENYKNYPYFEGKYLETVPFRTTSLIEQPITIRYLDIKTNQEIVRFTHNQYFLNLSIRHTYVKVYYFDSFIVSIFPNKKET